MPRDGRWSSLPWIHPYRCWVGCALPCAGSHGAGLWLSPLAWPVAQPSASPWRRPPGPQALPLGCVPATDEISDALSLGSDASPRVGCSVWAQPCLIPRSGGLLWIDSSSDRLASNSDLSASTFSVIPSDSHKNRGRKRTYCCCRCVYVRDCQYRPRVSHMA